MDEIKIQLRFKVETQYGDYNDCLYFDSQKELDALSPDDIQAMKDARVAAWVYTIENPPPEEEPTEEDLQAQLDTLQKQLDDTTETLNTMVAMREGGGKLGGGKIGG